MCQPATFTESADELTQFPLGPLSLVFLAIFNIKKVRICQIRSFYNIKALKPWLFITADVMTIHQVPAHQEQLNLLHTSSATTPCSYQTFTAVTLLLLPAFFCSCNLDYVCWEGKKQQNQVKHCKFENSIIFSSRRGTKLCRYETLMNQNSRLGKWLCKVTGVQSIIYSSLCF